MPADVGWSDIGSWAAVGALSSPDAQGNVVRGEGVVMDASNVYLRSEEGLTAVVGVSDVIVINTGDATLVVAAHAADKVKTLVERLKAEGRREPLEHRRVYRPWGYYQTIDLGARYQVKRISVKSGASLSLQKHHHRSEHWIVVRGAADVTIDGEKPAHPRERVDLSADRLRPSPEQSRQDRPRAHRGADGQLPRRGRHRAHRGSLQPLVKPTGGQDMKMAGRARP